MSRIVRSTSLARGSVPANSFLVVLTCPPSYNIILKGVVLQNKGTTPTLADIQFWNGPRTANVSLVHQDLAPNETLLLDFWHVMNPADIAVVSSGAAGPLSYWLSGPLLLWPSFQPPLPIDPDATTVSGI